MRASWSIAALVFACAATPASTALAQCEGIGDPDATLAEAAPWRGSSLDVAQTLGASTLSKSSTLSYDPYYALDFNLCMQWYFKPALKASLEQTLDVELTDSNSTTTRREPVLGDTSLRVDARILTHHFGTGRYAGWNAGFELLAPTSPASQAASMIAGARVRTGLKLVTDRMPSRAFSVFEVSYLRRFSRDTTVIAESPYPCLAGSFESIDCTHLASATNLLDTLAAKLQLDVEIASPFWFEFIGALQWDRAHALADATFQTSSGSVVSLPDESNTHFRNSRKLTLGLIYDPETFVSLELSTSSGFAERNLDGSLRGPFRTADTSIILDAWFDLEALYAIAN